MAVLSGLKSRFISCEMAGPNADTIVLAKTPTPMTMSAASNILVSLVFG
jgi:hypothetical protein